MDIIVRFVNSHGEYFVTKILDTNNWEDACEEMQKMTIPKDASQVRIELD